MKQILKLVVISSGELRQYFLKVAFAKYFIKMRMISCSLQLVCNIVTETCLEQLIYIFFHLSFLDTHLKIIIKQGNYYN